MRKSVICNKTVRGYRHGEDDLQKIYQMMKQASAVGEVLTADSSAGSAGGTGGNGVLTEADAARLAAYQMLHEANSDVIDEILGVVRVPAASIDKEFLTMMGARTEDAYSDLIDYVRENSYYDTGTPAAASPAP